MSIFGYFAHKISLNITVPAWENYMKIWVKFTGTQTQQIQIVCLLKYCKRLVSSSVSTFTTFTEVWLYTLVVGGLLQLKASEFKTILWQHQVHTGQAWNTTMPNHTDSKHSKHVSTLVGRQRKY